MPTMPPIWKPTNPMGSGPYKLVEWNQGDHVTLGESRCYFVGPPAIKDVVLKGRARFELASERPGHGRYRSVEKIRQAVAISTAFDVVVTSSPTDRPNAPRPQQVLRKSLRSVSAFSTSRAENGSYMSRMFGDNLTAARANTPVLKKTKKKYPRWQNDAES